MRISQTFSKTVIKHNHLYQVIMHLEDQERDWTRSSHDNYREHYISETARTLGKVETDISQLWTPDQNL